MSGWTLGLLAFLLTFLLHSSLMIGGVWLATRLRLVREATTEDALWKIAIVGGVVTAGLQLGLGFEPLAGKIALTSETPRLAAPAESFTFVSDGAGRTPRARHEAPKATLAETARALPTRSARRPFASRNELAKPASPTEAASSSAWTLMPRDLGQLAAVLWAALASVGIVRWLSARRRLSNALADRTHVSNGALLAILSKLCRRAGLRTRVDLTSSSFLAGPVVVGPREICIPPRAVNELSPLEQEAMMAHEMAHVRRKDPLWLNITAVLESVFFFQPLLRLARRRWQDVSEYLCDDWAVQATGRRLVLAECLARVAGWVRREPSMPLVPGMARNDSSLVKRVERIASGKSRRSHHGLRAVAACLLMLGVVSCGVPSFVSDLEGDGWIASLHRSLHSVHESDDAEGDGGDGFRSASMAVPAAYLEVAGDDEDDVTVVIEDGRVKIFANGRQVPVEMLEEEGHIRIGDTLVVLDGDAVHLMGQDGKAHMTLGRASLAPRRQPRAARQRTAREGARSDEREPADAEREMRRALEQLERQHERLVRDFERQIHDLEREHDQAYREIEREAERHDTHLQREYRERRKDVEHELHHEHKAREKELRREWDVARRELENERHSMDREDFADEDEAEEWVEEWEDRFEEVEETFHDHYAELADGFEGRIDEWIAEYEDDFEGMSEDVFEGYEERLEEIEDVFEDRFEELEDAFEGSEEELEEAYEELEAHFEELFEELGGCDHDCEYRCRGGCTHEEGGHVREHEHEHHDGHDVFMGHWDIEWEGEWDEELADAWEDQWDDAWDDAWDEEWADAWDEEWTDWEIEWEDDFEEALGELDAWCFEDEDECCEDECEDAKKEPCGEGPCEGGPCEDEPCEDGPCEDGPKDEPKAKPAKKKSGSVVKADPLRWDQAFARQVAQRWARN